MLLSDRDLSDDDYRLVLRLVKEYGPADMMVALTNAVYHLRFKATHAPHLFEADVELLQQQEDLMKECAEKLRGLG